MFLLVSFYIKKKKRPIKGSLFKPNERLSNGEISD